MAIQDFFTCTFGFCTGVAEASCVPHAPQKARRPEANCRTWDKT